MMRLSRQRRAGAALHACWCAHRRAMLFALGGLLLAWVVPLMLICGHALCCYFGAADAPQNLALGGALAGGTGAVVAMAGLVLGQEQERLHRLASTDALTGLHNRSYFTQELGREMERARRYGTPLSLLLIDVDKLKAINDCHGHTGGDRAIVAVAHTLQRSMRRSDTVARYAGDEFVVLLPQTPAGAAAALARRICQAVRQGQGQAGGTVSVSVGVAACTGWRHDSAMQLFAAADTALYRAKAAGRDQVAMAPAMPAVPLQAASA